MFNYKRLALAIASIIGMLGFSGVAQSAGLDRSGQDVTAFLQDGTYGEVVYTYIDANVSGKDKSGNTVPDMAEAYDFARFGVKADVNDRISVAVLYDEPFGAAVQYGGNNNFVSADADVTYGALVKDTAIQSIPRAITSQAVNADGTINATGYATAVQTITGILSTQIMSADPTLTATQAAALAQPKAEEAVKASIAANRVANNAETQKGQGTNVEIRTQNATLLMGAKLGQNKNVQIYGGPAMQRLTGQVHLRGVTYGGMNGYDANIGADMGYGWVVGMAYHKPEIALKAAVTYRSEIEHERSIAEVVPATGYNNARTDFKVTLPESWNLDFQTGLNPTTLLTAKVRYVPWSKFDIRPPQYGTVTQASTGTALPIVSYSKDQWSAEVGLGKKLNDKVSVQGSVGYDSGAGNPATSLGPIKGYYSVGLGSKYNLTPEWSVSLGAKYFKFGDATAQLPTGVQVADFTDNDGYAVGVKLAYQKK